MKRLLFLALPFSALFAFANEPKLNLTPLTRTVFEEGGSFPRLTFDGGKVTHTLTLDHELNLEKLALGVNITFSRIPDSSFSILPTPIPADKPLKPENLEHYLKAALTQAPQRATNVALIEEVPAPHPINSWTSHQYVIGYKIGTFSMKMAVTFLTLEDGAQIMLVTKSTEEMYNDAIARSDTLLRSWNTVSKEGTAPSGS